jgi:hypothetical protein
LLLNVITPKRNGTDEKSVYYKNVIADVRKCRPEYLGGTDDKSFLSRFFPEKKKDDVSAVTAISTNEVRLRARAFQGENGEKAFAEAKSAQVPTLFALANQEPLKPRTVVKTQTHLGRTWTLA